ncbi:MAG: ethanolamine utilization protein EutJ [Verrucomicrobia bacterium]|nr:MAG: ethanolamine utilization protein EutJ [Verrucomicrobiota bacterium]
MHPPIIRIKTFTVLSGLLMTVLLAIALSACKQESNNGKKIADIPIGLYASLTGAEASYGVDSLHAIQLAVDEINSHGGLLGGHQIQLIVRDNQSKAGESSLIARELIHRNHVIALLGEVAGGRSLEAAPIAQKAEVPMISSSTVARVTQIGNYIFRTAFIDEFQGKVMAKFMRSLGIRRVAILSDTSTDYSIGLAKSFAHEFVTGGGQIIAQQSFSEGDKDFNAQLTALKAANPEAIFLPTYYTYAGAIISQARQIGLNAPFTGADGFDSRGLLKIGGKAVEGVYFVSHFTSDNQNPTVQNFVKAYSQKYGDLPSSLAALAYDSMKLLADAIERAKSVETTKIQAALENTKNFPGVTGTITFDENRNPQKSAVIIRVQNGKFTYLETVSL